jgi:hypothetical protein
LCDIERRNAKLVGHLCIAWAVMSWPVALVALSLLQFLPVYLSAWWYVREVAIPPLVYLIAFWPCVLGGLAAVAAILAAARARSTTLVLEAAFAILSAVVLYAASAFILTRFHHG